MRHFIYISIMAFAIACSNKAPAPKPHAYPRVYYPKRNYIAFDTNAPFSFQYPAYAQIVNYNDESDTVHAHWYNINYLPFNATLHLSYHQFKDRTGFDRLFDDTRKLAYKHDIKAEDITPLEFQNSVNGTSGMIYELTGNTATNLNFYISDSKRNFLRGALYFNSKTQIDSIEPVLNFIRADINKMLETTRFK